MNILKSTSSFDASDHVPVCFLETAHSSCLLFQRTFDCLVDVSRVIEVDHMDLSLSCCNDQKLFLRIHGVDSLVTLDGSGWIWRTHIPIFDGLVPGARNNHGGIIWSINKTYASNRLIVGCNLDGGCSIRAEVEEFRSFICAGTDNFLTVLDFY